MVRYSVCPAESMLVNSGGGLISGTSDSFLDALLLLW